jgi:sulfoxide reductase heme-binding subunit YedZ
VDEALWAFGRGSGVISLALLTVGVVLGIVNRSGRPLPGMPRFAVALVHRNVALLASAFLVLHVATLIFDPFSKFTLVDVVVPFVGSVKPLWLGLGTVATDLVIAIVVTGLLRRRVGVRVFRFVHWFTYAMWPVALLHAIGDGTDGLSAWFLVFAVVSTALVVGAVFWRISARFGETARARQETLS